VCKAVGSPGLPYGLLEAFVAQLVSVARVRQVITRFSTSTLLCQPRLLFVQQVVYFPDQFHKPIRVLLGSGLLAKNLPSFLDFVFHNYLSPR
jgi:hypothetical protein